MSTAEPFMPAHEPPAPAPAQDRDIDHDTDVLLGDAGKEAVAEESRDFSAVETPFQRPVPGDHVSQAELEDDLQSGGD